MDIDIRKEQENTLLGQVNAILESGEFDKPEEEIQEEETVLGEMTAYEKALFTAFNKSIDKHNELVDKVRAGEADEDDLALTHYTCDSLKSLFWTSIKHRLGKPATEPDGLGVRNGWEIVAMNGNGHGHGHGGSRIIQVGGGGLLGALLGAGMPEGVHDCESCPDHIYYPCSNPDKKPRG